MFCLCGRKSQAPSLLGGCYYEESQLSTGAPTALSRSGRSSSKRCSANARKRSPSTGPRYSAGVRMEFARRASAAAPKSPLELDQVGRVTLAGADVVDTSRVLTVADAFKKVRSLSPSLSREVVDHDATRFMRPRPSCARR
jgi:hypothetical protein